MADSRDSDLLGALHSAVLVERELLLHDSTTHDSRSVGGGSGRVDLWTHDAHTSLHPGEDGVGENDNEADEWNDVGDADVGSISNGTLDWWEDGTTRDTHDQDTSTTAGVLAKVGGTKGEDGWVHWGLEEEESDEDTDGSLAVTSSDESVKCDGADGEDGENERWLKDGGKGGSDETSDGERDQSVGEEVRGLSSRVGSVLSGVVDEERSDGNLGTNVAELCNETEDHVVLLVERLGWDDTAVLIGELDVGGTLEGRLRDFRKLADGEENSDGDTSARDTEVDVLDVGEVVLILTSEEGVGGDERSDEGSDTVPGLTELETSRGALWSTNDDSVGVGSSLEGSKTASDDESADTETTEGSRCLGSAGEMCSRPEEDGTERVERETHQNSDLVTLSLEDLSGDWGKAEVTTTEVHDLKTGGLELGDTEDSLEVLVENIEKTVRETPEEEERGDEKDWVGELATSQVATLNGGGADRWDTASCHCDEVCSL